MPSQLPLLFGDQLRERLEGPGLLETSHTEAESVEVKDYLDSIEVLKEAVKQLGTMVRGGRH